MRDIPHIFIEDDLNRKPQSRFLYKQVRLLTQRHLGFEKNSGSMRFLIEEAERRIEQIIAEVWGEGKDYNIYV
ncbi:MAG: hypothetical protein HZB54_02475 [Deltaproteobacteria bacterium]|nr:hypothetical protein [Deltaproteobacteria bacterium]